MQVVVGETLPGLILNIASLSVSALALLVLNWPLGVLVVALGLPVFALAYSRTSRSLHRAGRDLQDTFGATTAFLSENLVAQAVIRSFTLEPRAREMIDRFLLEIFRSRMQTVRLEALLTGGSDLIYYGTRLAVLAAGAVLVLNDRLSLGELVAALWLTGAVFQPVAGMMTHYRGLVGAAGAFDRVRELLEEQVVGVDPALLGRVPLLAPVAAPMLAAIASRVSVETYAAGVTIVRQTELAEKLFIIASGSVEVLREDRGFVHRVRVLGERDYFGEIALFGSPGKRRIASVRTLEPTDVYGLHRDDFALILDAEPRLAEAVRLLAASREERTAAFRSAVTARGDV
jgi:ABC-type multidrug transport system fused ATPase/permease subunit